MTALLSDPITYTNTYASTPIAEPKDYKPGDRVLVCLEGDVAASTDCNDFTFVGTRPKTLQPLYLVGKKVSGVTLLAPAPPEWQDGDVISFRDSWTRDETTIVRHNMVWRLPNNPETLTDRHVNLAWRKGTVRHLVHDGKPVKG